MMPSEYTLAYGLLVLSCVVIISFLTDLFAHKIRVPSVLVLLLLGVGLKLTLGWLGAPDFELSRYLPFLGTVGLILIVLEAALHLDVSRDSLPLIRKAAISAGGLLIITSIGIGAFLHLATGSPWHSCLVNAIPFSIISSAMAIPSAQTLDANSREFVTYESTFSDILGLLLFSMVVNGNGGLGNWILDLTSNTVVTIVLSILLAIALVWLVTKLRHHIKFLLVLFILLLAYSLAKLFHLPALLMVFLFGLALNNANLLVVWEPLRKHLNLRKVNSELRYTRAATGESAFLVRTLFFVLFGYTLDWRMVVHMTILQFAIALFTVIYGIRWLYLRRFAVAHLYPEFWMAPRGLITVLLFYSIPDRFGLEDVGSGLVILIVITSAIMMAVGPLMQKKGVLQY